MLHRCSGGSRARAGAPLATRSRHPPPPPATATRRLHTPATRHPPPPGPTTAWHYHHEHFSDVGPAGGRRLPAATRRRLHRGRPRRRAQSVVQVRLAAAGSCSESKIRSTASVCGDASCAGCTTGGTTVRTWRWITAAASSCSAHTTAPALSPAPTAACPPSSTATVSVSGGGWRRSQS